MRVITVLFLAALLSGGLSAIFAQEAPSADTEAIAAEEVPAAAEVSMDAVPAAEVAGDVEAVAPEAEAAADEEAVAPDVEVAADEEAVAPDVEVAADEEAVAPDVEVAADEEAVAPDAEVASSTEVEAGIEALGTVATAAAPLRIPTKITVKLSSVDQGFVNRYAVGPYGNYAGTFLGAGARANFAIGGLGFLDSIPGFAAVVGLETSMGSSRTIWVNSFYDAKMTLGAACAFPIGGGFSIGPALDFGLLLHVLSGDPARANDPGIHSYADPIMSVALNLDYHFTSGFDLFLSPDLSMFPEKDYLGLLLGFSIGGRFPLNLGGVQ